jgi:peptidoglycan/xylan/chitin deacetylase (PgdA/CDA1 family)
MAAAAAVPAPAAARGHPWPLSVLAATVTQSGRQVTWTVQLTAPFAPAALAADGRALCLLVERPRTGTAFGQLCASGPAPGTRTARVAYQAITRAGPGPAGAIAATVTRTGARELTATFAPAAIDDAAYRPVRWQVRSSVSSAACLRSACAALFPAAPTLAALHAPQVVGCTATGPAFVANGPTDRKEMALTFDDGPGYQTAQFLDVLERERAPATFFEIGRQVGPFGLGGAIERRMLADGDMIGDHTWSHPDVGGAGLFAQQQIEDTAAAIRSATHGFIPCLFRAPYGVTSPALITEARSLGFTTIQWDIDPRDWARPGVSAIVANVLANARPGAIVIQHDGGGDRSQTVAALPLEIAGLRARGYTLVTVTQLLGEQLIHR